MELTMRIAFLVLFCSQISGNVDSLRSPECSKGSVYWCQNLKTAGSCNAVDFCIKSVWETHFVKNDSNVICDDCKEWVGKARELITNLDNSGSIIRSLKWTCDLIPVDVLKTDCENLVDENVPAIFKMLESKMEPNVVCSTMSLCLNKDYDKILEKNQTRTNNNLLPFTCGQCRVIESILDSKLRTFDQDAFLTKMLSVCGELSSYSDSCSGVLITHFDDIYKTMFNLIAKNNICRTSAACPKQNSREGIVDIRYGADSDPNIPCQLCQQMILHLRELLIANTSAVEFKNVMIGFCQQFGSFSSECKSIAEQYSDAIYDFLQDKLNANKACVLIEICPSKITEKPLQIPSSPLVPSEVHPMPNRTHRVVEVEINDSSLTLYKNGTACTTCEYFIHFIQEALRKQSTEDDIVRLMKKTCLDLPKKVQNECVAMVDLYGDAMMSLIDQEMDARYICPILKLCPPNTTLDYLERTAIDDKPTCPFCLMAMQEIKDIAESNSTKQYIESAIGKLCDHLSDKLKGQCTEFVRLYAEEVVEMILADFTPQEACTFIKLCTDSKPKYDRAQIVKDSDEDVDLVDIDDVEDQKDDKKDKFGLPQCELCKEIVKIVETRVINKKSKDEIRRELEKSCSRLKKFSEKCKAFVDKYSDQIVDLIEKELEPEEVCHELLFCVQADRSEFQDYDSGLDILNRAVKNTEIVADDDVKADPQCVMCEFVMAQLEKDLNNKKTDEEIKKAVLNVCSHLPATVSKSCHQFVDYYFDMILVFIETMSPSEVCAAMKCCPKPKPSELEMINKIKSDVFECATCKGVVQGLASIVEDPSSEVELEHLEEKICQKFAGPYKPKCHEIVNKYAVTILSLLMSLVGSDEICYKLDFCSQSNGFTGMLNGN